MFDFGFSKPRLLESFGISGVLGAESEVFYNVLYSTRHLGRVSDLLCARLRKSGIDELKLRTVLIFSVFEAYGAQFKRKGFRLFAKSDSDTLEEPLLLECGIDNEKLAIGVFFNLRENMNINVLDLPERIYKREAKTPFEKMLVELQEHTDRMILKYQPETRKLEVVLLVAISGKISPPSDRRPLELIIFEKLQVAQAPRPKRYVNFGDLNYPKLLQENTRDKKITSSPSGEFLMPGESSKEGEEVVVTIVPASESISDADGLVGESRQRREDLISVSSELDMGQMDILQIKGKGEDLSNQDVTIISGDQDLGSGSKWGNGQGSSQGSSQSSSQGNGKMNGFLEKAKYAFKNFKNKFRSAEPTDPEEFQSEITNISEARDPLGIDINKAKLADPDVEVSKKVNLSIPLKEIELNNKISDLQEELKRKDAALKSMEQLKSEAEGDVDDTQSIQKHGVTQRMLALSKDKNAQLSRRVEELNSQLQVAQAAVSGKESAEYSDLREKYEHLYRQAEELKKANRKFMEHRADRAEVKGDSEEMKRKLEAAMRLIAASRRETIEVKSEVNRLREQVSHLEKEKKSEISKKPDGSTS